MTRGRSKKHSFPPVRLHFEIQGLQQLENRTSISKAQMWLSEVAQVLTSPLKWASYNRLGQKLTENNRNRGGQTVTQHEGEGQRQAHRSQCMKVFYILAWSPSGGSV